VICLYY